MNSLRRQNGFVFFYLFGVLAFAAATATFGFLELFSGWQKNFFHCRKEIIEELSAATQLKRAHEVTRQWTAEIEPVFAVLLETKTFSGTCSGLTRQRGKVWEIVLSEDRSLSNF